MPKAVNLRSLILATLFGFLGGALSSIAVPQLVFAQDEPAARITAREFRIVDEDGNVVGIIAATQAPTPGVTRHDNNKGITAPRLPAHGKIVLFDSDGNTVWSEPKGLLHPLTSGANR